MLTRKRQRKYLQKRGRRLLSYYAAFNNDERQEHLHKMRLEAKKIAAFVHFLADVERKRNLVKQLKSMKRIFKLAGIIRASHLNIRLANEHNLLDEKFIAEQKEIFDSGMTEYRLNYYENLDTLKSMLRKLSGSFSKIKEREVVRFYSEHIKAIADMFQSPDYVSSLHECRKKIKHLMYMLSLMPNSIIRKLKVDKNYLDTLQNLIGEWHDIEVAILLYQTKEEASQNDIDTLSIQFASKLAEIDVMASDFALKVRRKK